MPRKRILITGATGCLGSDLCDRFIGTGDYVTDSLVHIRDFASPDSLRYYTPKKQVQPSKSNSLATYYLFGLTKVKTERILVTFTYDICRKLVPSQQMKSTQVVLI